MDSSFVYHMFPSSNKPLHEHVLSSHKGKSLLFHGRVFFYRSSWPPTNLSESIVHFAREVFHLASVSVVCSLFVHHMFPHSTCRVHAPPGGRLLPFYGWISGGGIPVLASALAGARMARRPGASWIGLFDEGKQGGNLNGAPRWEGSRTRRRPRH